MCFHVHQMALRTALSESLKGEKSTEGRERRRGAVVAVWVAGGRRVQWRCGCTLLTFRCHRGIGPAVDVVAIEAVAVYDIL